MEQNLSVNYIIKWMLPEGLAIAASAVYLVAAKRMVPKGVPVDSFRVRILSFVGLLSCMLSGTYVVLIGGTWNGLVLAEPFELSATILFGILILQPNLIAKAKLRIYLAVCVALAGLVAMVSIGDAWWLIH